jgi:two-component system, OmpR family, sensor kinase
VSRLPIRIRLTLLFALAMTVVLSSVGAFLYLRLGASLDEQLDDSLEARAATLLGVVGTAPVDETTLSGDDEEFAQVLASDGSVVASTRGLADASLLSGTELVRARGAEIMVEREVRLPDGGDVPARLLAMPVEGDRVLVVGASLGDRDETLQRLLAQLLIGGPAALLLASGAAYLLAGAALRPVEAMRRGANEISAETAGRRLPLPNSDDEIFRLGETLNAMLDRLDEGLRRERRFVADAGHELRTPLALLQTELELALRRPRSRPELETALGSASEEVERLARLAEDLLVLASTEDGTLPLKPSEFSVRELLESVARRFAARAGEHERPLEVEAPRDQTGWGDPVRLEQALGNLVDNALRHGCGPVRLEAAREDGRLAFRVRDHGPGFPPEFLPHAFERFSRADDARPRGGAGLGLALVAAVARAHGGGVTASNAAPGGAVVTIAIPSTPAAPPAETPPALPSAPPAS